MFYSGAFSIGALYTLAGLAAFANAQSNDSSPVSFFHSRPDLLAPALNVTSSNLSAVSPGYVFMAPYQALQAGPYIYDKMGNLVWSGYAEVGAYNAHNFYPCPYKGQNALCMFQGNQLSGYARGHAVILNQDYQIIDTISSAGGVVPADQHEFKMTAGGETALITVYQQIAWDLSRIGLTRNQGWVMDSIFQEINMTDGSVIFDWSSLNNVDPYTSYVYPKSSDISGDGLGPQTAWDYFHMNSVDKSNLTGNYIISARHMSTIYNINATDGSIIWRLQAGGDSDFACTDFNFSYQHDAQIVAENATSITLSMYDNASNNFNKTSDQSSGKILTIDYNSKTASLSAPLTVFPGTKNILSASQGNTQVLSNGNIFHGWGDWPLFSEHTPDGNAVWTANIGPNQGEVMNYRAFSGEWYSIPSTTVPALWTFSKNTDALVAMYVSWNGCTEVMTWTFYGANDYYDTFTKIGGTSKNGFETIYQSETHYIYTFAEAIGYDGSSLRNSSIQQTFVPSADLAASCFDIACPGAP